MIDNGGENSLKIPAPLLLQFGRVIVLKILNERMTQTEMIKEKICLGSRFAVREGEGGWGGWGG